MDPIPTGHQLHGLTITKGIEYRGTNLPHRLRTKLPFCKPWIERIHVKRKFGQMDAHEVSFGSYEWGRFATRAKMEPRVLRWPRCDTPLVTV
ncbi:hypothetical protein AG1IA_07938 [Rhizoctonia solani AG-1 IA]|uniref:Uncharacterized protein n=1 Tax=Thanatephorus cucumeris (strain AG1-IA) TaxID=983506 RepID=L8WMM6_THACA|nr:hypothetical protein AG1IA_07938 [Rhizoctonia solani AG-1 IA]